MSLAWFEGVCAEMSRNPRWSTDQITEFRDTDAAHGLCMQFLTESTNDLVIFQVLTVLQYTTVKNWARFEQGDRESIRMCLWTKIVTNHSSLPSYIMGKTLQLFALSWKCGWASESQESRESLLTGISANLIQTGCPEASVVASGLLRATIEEFSSRSGAQIGASLEFHRVSHVAFEAYGLSESMSLALQLLSTSVATLTAQQHQEGGGFLLLLSLL